MNGAHDEPRGRGRARVLVTGIRGFTGRHLASELAGHGYDVVGTVLDAPAANERRLDVTSPDDCAALIAAVAPDYVIHLAAISFVAHADAAAFYRVNTVGTMSLLDALARHAPHVRKVVIASSANVYGNVGGPAIGEATPFAPANHYAASKVAMEYMVAGCFERLPIVLTRPFNYTGVGQSPSFLIPKIVSHFARGARTIELGNVDVARDFSDVSVVVDAYRRLLEADARSRAFNICSGTSTSLADVIATMESIAGYAIEVRVNPAFVRVNEIRTLTGDPGALAAAIGPQKPVPLRTTLEAMYADLGSRERVAREA